MITIPFDVTRDGCDVRIVCFDRKTEHEYSIVALVDEGGIEVTLNYNRTGKLSFHESRKLFLQIPEWAQFKDGDVLACEVDNGGGDYCKWLSVLNGNIGFMISNLCFRSYVSYDYDSAYRTRQITYDEICDNIDSIRLATEEEKHKFIKRLKEENTVKARICLKRFFGIEETEEKPEGEFKGEVKDKFEFLQPVLARNEKTLKWVYGEFTHKVNDIYFLNGSAGFIYCIPYNDQTKHLLGTTDNWEE